MNDLKQSYEKLLQSREQDLASTKTNLNQKIADWKERYKDRGRELRRTEAELLSFKSTVQVNNRAIQCELLKKYNPEAWNS